MTEDEENNHFENSLYWSWGIIHDPTMPALDDFGLRLVQAGIQTLGNNILLLDEQTHNEEIVFETVVLGGAKIKTKLEITAEVTQDYVRLELQSTPVSLDGEINSSWFQGSLSVLGNFLKKAEALGISSTINLDSDILIETIFDKTSGLWSTPTYHGRFNLDVTFSSDLIQLMISILNPELLPIWKSIAGDHGIIESISINIDLNLQKIGSETKTNLFTAVSGNVEIILPIITISGEIKTSGQISYLSNETGGYADFDLGLYGELNVSLNLLFANFDYSFNHTFLRLNYGPYNLWTIGNRVPFVNNIELVPSSSNFNKNLSLKYSFVDADNDLLQIQTAY